MLEELDLTRRVKEFVELLMKFETFRNRKNDINALIDDIF